MKHTAVITLISMLFTAAAIAQEGSALPPAELQPQAPAAVYPRIQPGETVNAVIDTTRNTPYVTYRLEVPPSASTIQLVIEGASYDLDMYLKRGSEILDYNEADYFSKSDDFNEVLVIDRLSAPPLSPGEYFLDVAYPWEETPRLDGYPEGIIPFTLSYRLEEPRIRAALVPGKVHRDVIGEDGGMFCLY
ncbi:MAG: PPC domain-containing protein, partial [Spirochaetales bacterium]|nr:PPC domain-containing protein [Spirochaetales bacterium]